MDSLKSKRPFPSNGITGEVLEEAGLQKSGPMTKYFNITLRTVDIPTKLSPETISKVINVEIMIFIKLKGRSLYLLAYQKSCRRSTQPTNITH